MDDKEKLKLYICVFIGLLSLTLLLRYYNMKDKEVHEDEQNELCLAKYHVLQKYNDNGCPVKNSLKILNKYFEVDSIYTDLISLSEEDTVLQVFGFVQERKLGKLPFHTRVSIDDSLKLSKISLTVNDSVGFQYLDVENGKLIKAPTNRIIESHLNEIQQEKADRKNNLRLLKSNKFAIRFGLTEKENDKLRGGYSIEDVILAVTDGWCCYNQEAEYDRSGKLSRITCSEENLRNNDGKFSEFYHVASMIDKATKVRHRVIRNNKEHIAYEWGYGKIWISLEGNSDIYIMSDSRYMSIELSISQRN